MLTAGRLATLAVAIVVIALAVRAALPRRAGDHVARRLGFAVGHYPVFSGRFTGSPSPFHETVATLRGKGAQLQPPSVAASLWRQSVQSAVIGNYRLPIYLAAPDEPLYRFSCVTYGRCGADGMRVHLPTWARSSDDGDHHLMVVDPAAGGELDGWGGDGRSDHVCAPDAGRIPCSWGGFFPFHGNGLDDNSGDSANNGGYAFGLFVVTAQELLAGRVDHALGLVTSCLDDPDIYPADTLKHTDTSCSGKTGQGNPQYGQLVHLRASYDIADSVYSPECKTLLTALQTYGAYTSDTNNGYGIVLATDDVTLYADPNPWFTKILPDMVRYGDADGAGTSFRFRSCLNRLNSSDIEVYDIAPGS